MTCNASENRIDICVCTFRRPQLVETLQSLADQNAPHGYDVQILVVDNDDQPSAAHIVRAKQAKSRFHMRYVHCPAGNISIARNGALDHSDARLLAFIDDDETVDPDWLRNMVDVLENEGSDVVLGPVQAIYDEQAPAWMKSLDIHSTEPSFVKGVIETGYSCNVLLDRDSKAVQGLRFDLNLGQSGGEDTVFFTQIFRRGGRLDYAQNALVFEVVPSARQSFMWLLKRRMRMGHTHGHLLRDIGGSTGKIRNLALATAKLGYCAIDAVFSLPNSARRNSAILRGTLHSGVVLGLLGTANMQQYGSELEHAADE